MWTNKLEYHHFFAAFMFTNSTFNIITSFQSKNPQQQQQIKHVYKINSHSKYFTAHYGSDDDDAAASAVVSWYYLNWWTKYVSIRIQLQFSGLLMWINLVMIEWNPNQNQNQMGKILTKNNANKKTIQTKTEKIVPNVLGFHND